MNKHERTDILYPEGFREKISKARIAVVGLGAVGSYTVEILARFGVENLILIDFDKVEASNINRQLYALESTIGLNKCDIAKGRVLDINSSAKITCVNAFVDKDNLAELFLDKVDLIVDAIDTLSSKCDIAEFALNNDIKFVASMGAARRTDLSKIKTASIFKTTNCPLASKMRKQLKKRDLKGKTFQCVFSDEQASESSHLMSASAGQRKVIGSSPSVTAAFGIHLANLAISSL
ncbi:MAG: tRNA threonylcarbamoyladenosine dehydratase [Opitutales bacterium]